MNDGEKNWPDTLCGRIEAYVAALGRYPGVTLPGDRDGCLALRNTPAPDGSVLHMMKSTLDALAAAPPSEFDSVRKRFPNGVYGGIDPVTGRSGWIDIDAINAAVGRVRANGAAWYNRLSFAKRHKLELFRDGDAADDHAHNQQGYGKPLFIRVTGVNERRHFKQNIRKDVRDEVMKPGFCACCGRRNHLECDHKNGRKEPGSDVSNGIQDPLDFQPLCKSCNDYKRQVCRLCKAEGCTRRIARGTLYGYPIDFTAGDESYCGCEGCLFHDFMAFKRSLWGEAASDDAHHKSQS